MLLSGRRYNDQVRAHPYFLEANMWITGGWAGYFVLASAVTALTYPWCAFALAGPTPLLGWASFVVGERFAGWKVRAEMMKGAKAMTEPSEDSGPSRDDLRNLMQGKSDHEILALLAETPGGVEGMLSATLAGMAGALDPDCAQDCVVGYEIASDAGDSYSYRVEVRGHEVDAAERPLDDARVVLQLDVPDFLRLITGLLEGTEAFMSGRMRIRGDVMFAPQIGRMFGTA
jgi:putative sterol carrier protein